MDVLPENVTQNITFLSLSGDLTIKHFGIFFLTLIFSGIFSASEIAIFRVQNYQLKDSNGTLKKKYRKLQHLINHKEKTLATILIGNNIANVCATLYGTHLFTRIITGSALDIQAETFNQELTIAIAGVFIIILLLLFGEIVPKSIAIHNSFRWAIKLSFIIYIAFKIFSVLTFITMKLSSWINKFFKESDNKVSEEQVLAIVKQAGEEGVFEKNEQEVIKNILNFNETSAVAIMTPSKKVFTLSETQKISQVQEQIAAQGNSRIPIYKGNHRNNITGIIHQKDILKHLLKKNGKEVTLKALAQGPTYIYQTTSIQHVFQILQKKHQQIGIVVDDFGDFEGIITMEDILEEIVGEMRDENDNLQQDPSLTLLKKNQWVAKNIVDINTFTRITGVEINEHEKLPYETLQGLIMYKIGRLPKVGDKVIIKNFRFIVKKMNEDQISLIYITKIIEKTN